MCVCVCVRACMGQAVDELFLHALDIFEESSMLRAMLAQYIRIFRANRHIEMLHVASAEVRPTGSAAGLAHLPWPASFARSRPCVSRVACSIGGRPHECRCQALVPTGRGACAGVIGVCVYVVAAVEWA